MKKFVCLLWALYLFLPAFAVQEKVGQWQSYLSCYNTTRVAEGNNYVFAVAGGEVKDGEIDGSLYSYNKADQSITYYSQKTGLSDNQINRIGYNPEVNTLLIAYKGSGNIDLMGEGGVYNLPYLKNNINIQNKSINELFFYKEYAYLSTGFGVLVINMKKREIADTYKLNQTVYSVTIKEDYIYAATSTGIIRGKLTDNLLDSKVWQPYPLNSEVIKQADIRQLALFQGQLCFLVKSKGIYCQQADGSIKALLPDGNIQGMTVQNNKLLSFTTDRVYVSSTLTAYETIMTGTVNGIASLKEANTYWIAAGADGIKGFRKSGNAATYETIFSGIQTNAPKRNLAAFMTMSGNKLLVAGGGRWTDRFLRPGTLMTYENETWFNFNENDINKKANVTCQDYTGVAVDPRDPNHYFVSTYGEGILELKDNEFVNLHNQSSTHGALTSVLPNNPDHYVRIGSVIFDKQNNLWTVNTQVQNVINVLKADGSWASLYYPDISKASMVDKILITSKGVKWVNIPYHDAGLFVFDDKGTIDDTSDDQYKLHRSLVNAKGENIDVSGFFCMAEDKSGQIWIGTNKGLIISPQPGRALEEEGARMYFNRIIRTKDDGTPFYFLDNAKVLSIAIDGGNRKWVGTEGAGVFLISEDGMETIHNFTAENSPLLSNVIESIAINQSTGEVFFGTPNGIVSYQSDAIQGQQDYSDVYAYPNPVRPEFDDQVTVTGLMEESNVKITDVSGNIIYQGKSVGGQLTWNCRNRKGDRVATGVYLVLSANPGASESVVTKIMIVK